MPSIEKLQRTMQQKDEEYNELLNGAIEYEKKLKKELSRTYEHIKKIEDELRTVTKERDKYKNQLMFESERDSDTIDNLSAELEKTKKELSELINKQDDYKDKLITELEQLRKENEELKQQNTKTFYIYKHFMRAKDEIETGLNKIKREKCYWNVDKAV